MRGRTRVLSVALVLASGLALVGCKSAKESVAASTFQETCGPRAVSVYFDQWEHELNKPARDIINRLIVSLKGCKISHVRIVGLADAVGDEETNLQVSDQRAATIADALEKGGWPRNTFELVAVGDRNATKEDGTMKPMRRRAHITVKASDF